MTLDLDTLQTLVLTHDLRGYRQAADRLGRTPSAISLQMKRLQDDVGAPLFRKDGRGTALTEAGEIVLRYARKMLALNDELLHTVRGAHLAGTVRLGFSQDFAETVLPQVLSRFSALYPLVQMEVRIEGNAALVQAVDTGEIDIALAVGQADRPTAEVLGELDLVWIAGDQFTTRPEQPLPLVLLGPLCAFRKQAIQRLEDAGLPWRLAAVSPSLAGLWASALGGLGITARTALGLPAGLTWHKALFELPALGTFPATLHVRPKERSEAVDVLRNLIQQSVAGALPRRKSKHLTAK